jgi:hypothetical protein
MPRPRLAKRGDTRRAGAIAVTYVPGRDIGELLSPAPGRRQPLKGFDPDYVDFVDYIIRCTHRIWEEKRLDLIRTHYTRDCVIHALGGEVRGAEAVVRNTARTLSAFPDRTLFGDHVIWSGDDRRGFYSSHRITSHLTNLGGSDYGPATGRHAVVVTIADCAVKANRIYEEWLVRDNLGLVLQLGLDPHAVARDQARKATAALRRWRKSESCRVRAAHGPRTSALPDARAAPAAFARAAMECLWNQRALGLARDVYAPAAAFIGPSGRDLLGPGEIVGFVASILGALPDACLGVDHVCAVDGPDGTTDVALRWTLAGRHAGPGLYGPPTDREILILGCTHWRIQDRRIVEDWTVFDELAVLAQVYGG